jgi:hypothetical protein
MSDVFWILGVMMFGALGGEGARAEEAPCALVTRVGRGVQVIPESGRVMNKVQMDLAIPCGTMILTHDESLWIRLSNQTTVKMGPRSFVEIPRDNVKSYRLYRGVVLLSAPTTLLAQTWSTPNSELDFKGGVTVLQYLPDEKKTFAGCFNRKVEFRNKFNSGAIQELSAGEMSHLAIQEGRVRPAQPMVMHHSSVAGVLSQIGLSSGDQEQIVAVVKQVYEDRSKALVSGIHDWSEFEEEPARGIASVGSTAAVDVREAEFNLKQLKNRLYGSEAEQKMYVPPVFPEREPASLKENFSRALSSDDGEKKRRESAFRAETKRIEREIERLRPDALD